MTESTSIFLCYYIWHEIFTQIEVRKNACFKNFLKKLQHMFITYIRTENTCAITFLRETFLSDIHKKSHFYVKFFSVAVERPEQAIAGRLTDTQSAFYMGPNHPTSSFNRKDVRYNRAITYTYGVFYGKVRHGCLIVLTFDVYEN